MARWPRACGKHGQACKVELCGSMCGRHAALNRVPASPALDDARVGLDAQGNQRGAQLGAVQLRVCGGERARQDPHAQPPRCRSLLRTR